MKNSLLLHICCAPCGGGCITHPLLEEWDKSPGQLYFSNSNLDSEEEFERRLECVLQLGKYFNIPVVVDPYDHNAWLDAVKGFEACSEGGARCQRCFRYSLGRAAAAAAAENMEFATTLTVSPRKSSRAIFDVGSEWEHFVPIDFKKKNGYLNGTRLAQQLNFYRQKYCGCEFSKAHSTAAEITPPPAKKPASS